MDAQTTKSYLEKAIKFYKEMGTITQVEDRKKFINNLAPSLTDKVMVKTACQAVKEDTEMSKRFGVLSDKIDESLRIFEVELDNQRQDLTKKNPELTIQELTTLVEDMVGLAVKGFKLMLENIKSSIQASEKVEVASEYTPKAVDNKDYEFKVSEEKERKASESPNQQKVPSNIKIKPTNGSVVGVKNKKSTSAPSEAEAGGPSMS